MNWGPTLQSPGRLLRISALKYTSLMLVGLAGLFHDRKISMLPLVIVGNVFQ